MKSKYKKVLSVFLLIIVLICLIIFSLSSCSKHGFTFEETRLPTTSLFNSPTPKQEITPTDKLFLPIDTIEPSITPIITQALVATTSYRYIDTEFYDQYIYDSPTQQVVNTYIEKPSLEKYLYQNAIFTIWFNNGWGERWANIDLDELSNNDTKTADIQVVRTCGSDCFYHVASMNGAVYYYAEENDLDFDKCLSHFPVNVMDTSDYSLQGVFIFREGNLCVITNEGRMAIVKFRNFGIDENYSESISFLVDVYTEILQ